MRRYWIEANAVRGDSVRLTGDVLHHIRDVCRQRAGAKFEVLVPGGLAYFVEIISEGKNESLARILETRQIAPLPSPQIRLALSIPRFPVFEAVLEKAVELGVAAIHPFYSEFSFIRTRSDVFANKRARFEKIVQGATQQSGRGDLMPIHQPVDLSSLLDIFQNPTLNRPGRAAGLFAYEGESALSAREGLALARESDPTEVWAFVGSEGGFSEREVEIVREAGLQSVTLGPQVLRVETACVALTSIIKYDFDLMQ